MLNKDTKTNFYTWYSYEFLNPVLELLSELIFNFNFNFTYLTSNWSWIWRSTLIENLDHFDTKYFFDLSGGGLDMELRQS